MSSVEELLQLPTDEVRTWTSPFTPEDMSVVLREQGKLLWRWLYAARYSLAVPFTVFLSVFIQATDMEPHKMAKALLGNSEEGQHLCLLADVCEVFLSPVGNPLQAEVDVELVLKFLQVLSDMPLLKDVLGNALMKVLLVFLSDVVDCDRDYVQPRACASVLITLLRGSEVNRVRMSGGCNRIAEVLERSTDIYLQLQCVELLFRLYIHDRTVLATASLCELLKKDISKLPNDERLLERMLLLLESYNANQKASQIRQFTVVLIEVGNVEVCGCTKVYFSRSMLVIMMPGCTGDNITIPYEHIRCMRLTRERRLALRLHSIPHGLSGIMSHESGMDTLTISLTQASFNAVQASDIRNWVLARRNLVSANAGHRAAKASAELVAPACPKLGRLENTAECTAGEKLEGALLPTGSSLSHRLLASDTELQCSGKGEELEPSLGIMCGGESTTKYEESEDTGLLRDLREVATNRVTRMRQGCRRELESVLRFADEEIEKMKRINSSERDAFNTSLTEDLMMIQRVRGQVKAKTTQRVESLNQELATTQALGELLRDELCKFQDGLTAALQSSEGAEAFQLLQLKETVDAEMKFIKVKLMRLTSVTGPASLIAAHTPQQGASIGV